MQSESDNIIWQELSASNKSERTRISPSTDKIYPSLYEELKEKCNPKNFMLPYNREEVDVANALYGELMNIGRKDTEQLMNLRREATDKLKIYFSTAKLYQKLKDYCNPISYMNPYDREAVKRANNYYALIEEKKDSIEELEILERNIYRDVCLIKYRQDKKCSIDKSVSEQKCRMERLKSDEENKEVNVFYLFALFIWLLVVLAILFYDYR